MTVTRDTCRYVVSTRIRTGRSIVGFPFNPNMTEEQYEKMEVMAKEAFDKMPDDLAGDYYPLTGTLCSDIDKSVMIKCVNEIILRVQSPLKSIKLRYHENSLRPSVVLWQG